MAITVFCKDCNNSFRVKDEFAGKRGKCPAGHVVLVPVPDTDPVPDTEPLAFIEPAPLPLSPVRLPGVPQSSRLDTARKPTTPPKKKKAAKSGNGKLYLLLGVGAAVAVTVVAVILLTRDSAATPTAEKTAASSQPAIVPVRPAEPEPKLPVPPVGKNVERPAPLPPTPPLEPPKESPFDPASKLRLSGGSGVMHGNQVRISFVCNWSTGKPNPMGYATGKYRFTPVVTEFANGTLNIKLNKPDTREGLVTYNQSFSEVALVLTPGLPLTHLAAVGGEVAIRIGDADEMKLNHDSFYKREPLPKTPEPKVAVPAAEWEKLRGTWRRVSHYQFGEFFVDRTRNVDLKVVIEGETWTTTYNGKPGDMSQLTIDPSRTPKSLDIVTEIKGKTYTSEWIYRVNGDTLTIAMPGFTGGGRPQSFEHTPYTMVDVYTRGNAPPPPSPPKEAAGEAELAAWETKLKTVPESLLAVYYEASLLHLAGGTDGSYTMDGVFKQLDSPPPPAVMAALKEQLKGFVPGKPPNATVFSSRGKSPGSSGVAAGDIWQKAFAKIKWKK